MSNATNLKIQVMTITPIQAQFWLDNNNTRNRKAVQRVVKTYADDMINGRWEMTGQGVSFYENGVLADGQHRLLAVVMADKPIDMVVTYGLPLSAINGIDQHKIRSVHDVLTMTGSFGDVSPMSVAALRLCYPAMKSNAALMAQMYADNEADLQIVNDMFGRKNDKTSSALLRAAVLLALKAGASQRELKDFVEVLTTGVTSQPHHKTVILLRDICMRKESRGGDTERRRFVRRIQLAIHRFMKKDVAKRLAEPEYYIYPLIEAATLNREAAK